MKMIFGWTEERYHEICREFENKWLKSRHLYYSTEKLTEMIKKEQENARKGSV